MNVFGGKKYITPDFTHSGHNDKRLPDHLCDLRMSSDDFHIKRSAGCLRLLHHAPQFRLFQRLWKQERKQHADRLCT